MESERYASEPDPATAIEARQISDDFFELHTPQGKAELSLIADTPDGDIGNVNWLEVSASHQGEGIGATLLRAAAHICRTRNYRTLITSNVISLSSLACHAKAFGEQHLTFYDILPFKPNASTAPGRQQLNINYQEGYALLKQRLQAVDTGTVLPENATLEVRVDLTDPAVQTLFLSEVDNPHGYSPINIRYTDVGNDGLYFNNPSH